MSDSPSEHGFTSVDSQDDPQRLVRCLDLLHKEPFYVSYKARLVELLGPQPRGIYLDIGAGTSDDARALADKTRACVVAIDHSAVLMLEASRRGLGTVLIGSAAALPFPAGTFDGCWSDRTFQHLSDPERALDEMIRVTRPSGRLVVVDPDYGTQVMEFPDQELAGRVLRFRAERGLRNGMLAHRMADVFVAHGLSDVHVEERRLIVRDATAVDNVLGLRTWAGSAQPYGYLTKSEVATWERLFDDVVAAGRFLWSVTFFLTAGTRPPASKSRMTKPCATTPP
jgi:SAM-dependent methyltransferase